MPLQFRREPLGGLTLPFFGSVALTHVVIPVQETAGAEIRHVRDDGGRDYVIRQALQFVILEREIAVQGRVVFRRRRAVVLLSVAQIFDKVHQDQEPVAFRDESTFEIVSPTIYSEL